MLSISLSLIVVSADMFVAVRDGTLYRMIGRSTARAIASKCAYRPFWGGLL